jgi:hypothetical protein
MKLQLFPLIQGAISVLASLASRGFPAPLRVLTGIQAYENAGGESGDKEADAALEALSSAAESAVLSVDEKKTLAELLKKLLSALTEHGYPGYNKKAPEAEVTKAGQVVSEFVNSDGKTVKADKRELAEGDGIEWEVQVLESGISADGNYDYTPEAVRASCSLFEGLQSFADHAEKGKVPDIGDLIGWFTKPHVVEGMKVAIRATFNLLASSKMAPMIREAYQRNALESLGGFSINGSAEMEAQQGQNGQTVLKVLHIASLVSTDLVSKPNAGGKLLALKAAILASASGMKFNETLVKLPEKVSLTNASENLQSIQTATSLKEIEQLRQDLESVKATQLSARKEVLLSESRLPDQAVKVIHDQVMAAKSIEAAKEIVQNTKVLWALNEEVRAMNAAQVTTPDKPSAAVLRLQGLIAGQAIEGIQPYHSLREAYSEITGQRVDLYTPQEYATAIIRGAWGYDSTARPGQIQASIGVGDWPYTLGMALHREVIRDYALPQFDDWRKLVSNIGNLADMRQTDRTRTGYYDVLPVVGAGADYQPLSSPTEQMAYYSPAKYGGLEDFTWESAINDNLGELQKIPKKLALAAKVTLWYYILNIFAAGTPPLCTYDNVAVFHATHGNLGTVPLTLAGFTGARKIMKTQAVLGGTNIMIGAAPALVIVPEDLEAQALKLRNSEHDVDALGNLAANPWKGSFEVLTVPFWTDADAWAASADPKLVPTIEVGFLGGKDQPEIATEAANTGSNFTAEKVTYRVKLPFGYAILDHRGLYKSVPA